MRSTPLLLFFFLCFAGCTDPPLGTVCETTPLDHVLVERTGDSLLVDGGTLYLHTSKARIYEATEDGCSEISFEDIQEPWSSWRVGHDATEYAESYPAQAWPTTIVVQHQA